MNIQRLKEIEQLGVSPSELLEYALIKNNSGAIVQALVEHGLEKSGEEDPEISDFEPEDALEFALERLPNSILTTLLKPYGYQPIPNRKQAKREKALSH
jgi:hypothetical protein